ncbi:MAG: hypothetical protein COB50_00320 [Thiotrichales bacterium]|nr:MAG: hypothetical protein COB50_00320 [Thiotrichales bacterium]
MKDYASSYKQYDKVKKQQRQLVNKTKTAKPRNLLKVGALLFGLLLVFILLMYFARGTRRTFHRYMNDITHKQSATTADATASPTTINKKVLSQEPDINFYEKLKTQNSLTGHGTITS